jgi:tetratricopeptide (TPR) repeat protein
MKKELILGSFLLLVALCLNAQSDQLLKLAIDKFGSYDNGLRPRVYVPTSLKPGLTTERVKTEIARYLDKYTLNRDWKDNNEYAYYNDSTKVKGNKIKDPVIVTDDYIEFTASEEGRVRIYFKEILFEEIVHITQNGVYTCLLKIGKYHFSICITEFPDLLFYMQYMYGIKYSTDQVEAFKPVAQEYLSLKSKPAITEEQHMYFVQGNAMAEDRQGQKAIRLYNKAFAINPVSYPEGYFNLAVIASLTRNFPFAVCCMKKYLMLVPDAEDERVARDKIYEWEIQYSSIL